MTATGKVCRFIFGHKGIGTWTDTGLIGCLQKGGGVEKASLVWLDQHDMTSFSAS